jgi:hypothetical protein
VTVTLTRWVAQAVSTGSGLLMVESAAVGSHGLAVVTAVAGLIAVVFGTAFRPLATLAVLLTVGTVMLSCPAPVFVALSGLSAAAYLVCRHSLPAPGGAMVGSWPTAIGAVGFTFAGLVATSFPLQLPWLPLAAPVGALAIYVVAARPFLS